MSEISNLIVEGKMYFLNTQRTLLEIDVIMLITNFSMLDDFHLNNL